MTTDKPLSENINTYEAGGFIVTAAIWRTTIQGTLYDTFEIGIRHKESCEFNLIQNSNFNHQSVQEVANAIAHLLTMSSFPMTEHYDAKWCQKWFGDQ